MQNKLAPTSAPMGLGNTFNRNLFRVPSGAYSGRLAAVIHTSQSDIALYYADPPYKSWNGPITITSDCLESSCGCYMDDDGNIFVVYASAATGNLIFHKLSYANGLWTVGSVVTVTVRPPSTAMICPVT